MDRDTRRGWTLIETLISIGVIAVILSLALPALRGARIRAREVACGVRVGELWKLTTLYALDFRDSIPVRWSSRLRFHPGPPPPGKVNWYTYLFQVEYPAWEFWKRTMNQPATGGLVLCPGHHADGPGKSGPDAERWTDYAAGAFWYLNPSYLDPAVDVRDWTYERIATTHRLTDIAFPSQKVAMYEDWIWHRWFRAWTGDVGPESGGGLYASASVHASSLAWVDGSVSHRRKTGSGPFIDTYPTVPMFGPWDTTPHGIRGLDR